MSYLSVCLCVRAIEKESVCVRVSVCLCMSVYPSACECERERVFLTGERVSHTQRNANDSELSVAKKDGCFGFSVKIELTVKKKP